MYVDQIMMRKAELVGVLERMCQALELTDAQYETAKKRYEGVGKWLAEAESSFLRALSIYMQGSTALGTTVKPIGSNEHDVDLVAHMPNLGPLPPATVKKTIGDRLRANGHYAPLLKEKPRCWRLSYANEFHLDITPSIPNRGCGTDADIEPYPSAGGLKGMLRRTVQIAKRHRDIYFVDLDPCLAPISVVITSLASRSYEYCVGRFVYDNELDLLRDIVRHLPAFIETRVIGGLQQWFIWNETTSDENFAEKWNSDPSRAEAFYAWHTRALADLDKLADIQGLDQSNKSLSESFGPAPVTKALGALTEKVAAARRTGSLSVASSVGLSVGAGGASTGVRPNTFFGAK